MLRLGIMGFSEGNGHPYSWSAIFNGYHVDHMRMCGFPVIPEYLAQQSWPSARIEGAQVTHVWTQFPELSRRIAAAALIPEVVTDYREMLGHIDALLLARDDAKNHLELVRPFLEVGLPVYIDKPIAISLTDFERIHALEQYKGQIFTCSALRYAQELQLSKQDAESLGEVRHVDATTPKSWEKYGVHIIEPVLRLAACSPISIKAVSLGEAGTLVAVCFENGMTATLTALGDNVAAPISMKVYAERGWKEMLFNDAFSAFKMALQDFVDGIKNQECRSPKEFNRQVVTLIEAGGTCAR